MKYPVHKDPTCPDRTAWAPYNFVPLPEKVVTVSEKEIPGHDEYRLHTGRIDCTLVAETPLYTRAAMTPDFFAEAGYKPFHQFNEKQKEELAQFFAVGERLVIPGSSLRGMIRSLVEIVAYGKVQWVTGDPLIFRGVGDTSSMGVHYRSFFQEKSGNVFTSKVEAGYLEKHGDKWYIIPAMKVNGVSFGRIEIGDIPTNLETWTNCSNAHKIFVALDLPKDHIHSKGNIIRYAKVLKASSRPTNDCKDEMVLVETGRLPGKKHLQFVFGLPSDKKNWISINGNAVTRYLAVVDGHVEEDVSETPVFYLANNQQITDFGHTMMFRLPYRYTPLDFIPRELRRTTDIDLAEAIFGYEPAEDPETGEKREKGRAGRVFFSDAYLSGKPEKALYPNPIIPQVLGGPKPTAFPHYLTQTDPDDKKRLKHYDSQPVQDTVIRGHKFYWHKQGVDLERDIRENRPAEIEEHASQYTLIRPVRPGTMFAFEIHFENLADYELGCLLWALNLPSGYRHKLGMGKPLGMGSVRVETTLHLLDRRSRYMRLLDREWWNLGNEIPQGADHFIAAFEQFMFDRIDSNETVNCERLADVPRIKALLKMLEWPGPDRSKTSYMPLTRFKERGVLPSPFHRNFTKQ